MLGEKWRLGQAAQIHMGSSPPGSTYNLTGLGLPFFQGVADFGNRLPEIRVYCTDWRREADSGDILLSVRAPIGRVNIAPTRCAIGRGLAVIRPVASMDARFIEYALKSSTESWKVLESKGSV